MVPRPLHTQCRKGRRLVVLPAYRPSILVGTEMLCSETEKQGESVLRRQIDNPLWTLMKSPTFFRFNPTSSMPEFPYIQHFHSIKYLPWTLVDFNSSCLYVWYNQPGPCTFPPAGVPLHLKSLLYTMANQAVRHVTFELYLPCHQLNVYCYHNHLLIGTRLWRQ